MPNVLLTLNTTPRAYEPRIWIVVDHTIQHYTSLFPKGEVTIGYFHHRICYESLNLMLGCVGLLHWRFILLLSDQPGTSQRWQFKRIHNRILWEKRVCAPWGRAGMAVFGCESQTSWPNTTLWNGTAPRYQLYRRLQQIVRLYYRMYYVLHNALQMETAYML